MSERVWKSFESKAETSSCVGLKSAAPDTARCRRRIWKELISLTLVACALGAPLATPAAAQFEDMRFGWPGPGDLRKSEQQREIVGKLALRHLGEKIDGHAKSDLVLLQRLIDEGVVASDRVFDLQAMGVVLGDVMAANLRLHWVVVDDKYGHSRALRWRESPNVFFPVTMISKRLAAGSPVDVAALYAKTEKAVAELRQRSN